ncbi:MAG: hypothetical protein ABI390_01430 [Daejeonella sp.]
MDQEQLISILSELTGQLQSQGKQSEHGILELQKALASVLVNQEPILRQKKFTFENSEVFQPASITAQKRNNIEEIVNQVVKDNPSETHHVFVRNVRARTTQVEASISTKIAGSRVSKTLGPFDKLGGQELFFDFIKFESLIPLYIEGQTLPVILFKASFLKNRKFVFGKTDVQISRTYKVVPVSVWINARIFDVSSPEGFFAGLRVKGGDITLESDPFLINGKLTVNPQTKITVNLNLDQKIVTDADPESPFGQDARSAEYQLPDKFSFSFNGVGKQIISVSDCSNTIFGQHSNFVFDNNQNSIYNPTLNRVAIPLKSDQTEFTITSCQSPFIQISGTAPVVNSWWSIPAAKIDVASPYEADGNGGLVQELGEGLFSVWPGLQGQLLNKNPFLISEPGRISITDLKCNGANSAQNFNLWKDEKNSFGTTAELNFKTVIPFFYNSVAKGDELFLTFVDSDLKIDRPLKVNGEAVKVKSKNSALMIALSKLKKAITIYDDNILWDNKLPEDKIPVVKPFALALHNALFTVTPPNGAVLMGQLSDDYTNIIKGNLHLNFGLYSYLPTLPDPYAANLGTLNNQFNRSSEGRFKSLNSAVWLWLVANINWDKPAEEFNKTGLSFTFSKLTSALQVQREVKITEQDQNLNAGIIEKAFPQFAAETINAVDTAQPLFSEQTSNLMAMKFRGAEMEKVLLNGINRMITEDFALLDVSSKANQMGVAYSGNLEMRRSWGVRGNANNEQEGQLFPIQIEGMDVVTAGYNARAFTLPQIAWEPVFNIPNPDVPGVVGDPPVGWNYYKDDGIPTRIGNVCDDMVALSPIPLTKYLQQTFENKTDRKTYAYFNLPFGMLAFAILDNFSNQTKKPAINNVSPIFNNFINGGIQLELQAGSSIKEGDNDLFEGFTFQLYNVLDMFGNDASASTLGESVTNIFNKEFATPTADPTRPRVPLKKAGLSGYGANIFSDWHNDKALYAETSQALFNVTTGRTSHEVVQVKSVIYPWGIHVVRTITLFRLGNGYVGRVDSGWKAEGNGRFDFTYYDKVENPPGVFTLKEHENPFEIHPGMVRELSGIKNIREIEVTHKDGDASLRGLTFDADVELENVIEGGADNKVPSKGILGFVQLSPRGGPITDVQFDSLLKSQKGSIGGTINCSVKVAGTDQVVKINQFDVNSSVSADGSTKIFVAAARGSVVLPKDGSWSMVMHTRKDGAVAPLDEHTSVPLIRIGKWIQALRGIDTTEISKNLLRIAHPLEILRNPGNDTINFGFLQNLNSQKILFLTPSFKTGINSLLSKTPPLMADSYRLLNTVGIFPNIGDAETNFGAAISLLNGTDAAENAVKAFSKVSADGILDAGKDVLEIMEIKAKEEAGKLVDQGYKLIKQKGDALLNEAFRFDLPSVHYPLIDTEGFKVFIEYEAHSDPKHANKSYIGKYDFDVDSFATDLGNSWKGKMNNMAIAVDLGPLERVMTIKGNFNAQKGTETNLGGEKGLDPLNLPVPEIEFSDALKPVIQILEILAAVSTGDYKEALKKGLKVSMSNSANVWEYKFDASKDIPLVRFPFGALYDSPQTPLRLEASMSIGMYFNAALKVTTDPSQLLPTAGAFFKFHGGIQVMCVSVAAGSIYAVGNVDLMLAADTSPLVSVTMKFGFGAQITVGLPVIGNVSILFMVSVEIYADSSKKVIATAILLFRGHAEILGGLVGVTITIEAKGSIEKQGEDKPTTCKAQVTFALEISIFLVIDIDFSESWEEQRQIA